MTLPLVLAALLTAAPTAPTAPAGAGPEVFALLVGHNGAAPGLPTLRFADDDAVRMALLFSAHAPPENLWLLAVPDEQTLGQLERAGLSPPRARAPTRRALFAALDELAGRLRARARSRPAYVYVFYAGHGLDGRLLLQPEVGEQAAITGTELRPALAGLEAEGLMLFGDACRSQSLCVGRGEEGPDFSAEIAAQQSAARELRLGVITAAASDRPAGETPELGAGYFSHVLASGLAGAADADGDRLVRFGELAAFVAFNTQWMASQRPWFEPPGGDLDAPVIDLRGERAALVFDHADAGRLLISTRTGLPIFAEACTGASAPLRLVLPPGTYRLVRILGENTGEADDVQMSEGK